MYIRISLYLSEWFEKTVRWTNKYFECDQVKLAEIFCLKNWKKWKISISNKNGSVCSVLLNDQIGFNDGIVNNSSIALRVSCA